MGGEVRIRIETMIKNDKWIESSGIITPHHKLTRSVAVPPLEEGSETQRKVISFGQSSYGYDIRLSKKEFFVFAEPCPYEKPNVINPKDFGEASLFLTEYKEDKWGKFFVLPPHSYSLGVSMEYFKIPPNVTGIALGKSTYARCGLIVNITPLEAGWEGSLTLEFANTSPRPLRLYAEEGVAQILFFEGEDCNITYADRKGKYQSQAPGKVTLAKV